MSLKALQLEQTTAVQILLTLLKEGSLKMTDIINKIGGSHTTPYKALPILKNLGLINDEVTPYPVKRIFSLTEKGRKVASKLQEIEDILQQPS